MPPIAVVYACGLPWVIGHLAEVAAVSAGCGVLAVAAVVALMRRGDRRDERQRADASIWTVREVPRSGTRVPIPEASAGRPALGFRDLHIHLGGVQRLVQSGHLDSPQLNGTLNGLPDTGQAAVIRQALNRDPAGGD